MRIPVNGVKWNVTVTGSGSPLLLLHGFTGAGSNWEPFVPSWSDAFRLLMIDIIGHGLSDSPEDPARYAMERAAADLAGILDHFGIAKTDVLGYSMGGRLALMFTVRYPERVGRLILESSSPGLADPGDRQARVQRDEQLAEQIEREGIKKFVHYWENIPLFASQRSLPPSVRERVRLQRLRNNAVGLANSLRGMGTGAQPPLWRELEELSLPVLLICGEKDRKFCRIGEKMHARLPRSELRFVAGAGHTVHVEQPAVFGTIVRDYLKQGT